MAEKSATPDDDQSNKDFQAGFEGIDAATATADKPEKTEPEKSNPNPEAKADDPPKTTETQAHKPKAPEYVSITKEQFDRFEAAASKTADFEKQFNKAFGTIGNVQQAINRLQEATPRGAEIKLTRDIVAKMAEAFPELADSQYDALEKLVELINSSGGRGTGTEPAPTKPADASLDREIESLEDAYPDWKEIVGLSAPGQHDPKQPFRAWLATQPEDYQQRINNTNNARVIERAIDRFKAAAAEQAKTAKKPNDPPAPSPKAEARRTQLRESTNPRGSGPEPTRQKTADDHFREGFKGAD